MSKRNIRQPEGLNTEETAGFFMVSSKSVAIAINHKLSGSQLRLWLFLSLVQPFADRTTKGEKIFRHLPSPQEIGTKLGLSVETIRKDMRLLRKLELYDYQSLTWQGFNQSAEEAKKESQRIKKAKSQKSKEKKLSEGLNKLPKRLNNSSKGLNNLSESLNNPSEKAEGNANRGLGVASQTYSDFITSLSEEERENFIHFVQERTSNYREKINDLEGWLASNNNAGKERWEAFFKQYQESKLNESEGINDQGLSGLSSSETKKAISEFQKQLKRQSTVSEMIEDEKLLEVTTGDIS